MSRYPDHVRDAARRAADWLQANPDKHIIGVAVTDDDGEHVDNPQSKEATCFCAIGRLAREAGLTRIGDDDYSPINKLLGDPLRTNSIFMDNDRNKALGIARLRDVANDLEII